MKDDQAKGRWLAQVKGWSSYGQGFEVTVVREDNEHGRRSWGWIGPHKVLVMGGNTTKSAWRALEAPLRKYAEDLAAKFNREEGR